MFSNPKSLGSLREDLDDFGRNLRWGTCVACPCNSDGRQIPELCEYTARYDHQLNWDSLDFQVRREIKEVQARNSQTRIGQ